MNEEKRTLPIAIRVVSLNETDDFILGEYRAPLVKAIYAVYFYDKNEHTFLCEITPSYALNFLYYDVEFEYGVDNPDLEAEVLDIVETAPTEEVSYYHVRDIDAFEKRFVEDDIPCRFHAEEDEMLPDDMEYDEYIEDMREELVSNHVL
jgi:hypothetical protein